MGCFVGWGFDGEGISIVWHLTASKAGMGLRATKSRQEERHLKKSLVRLYRYLVDL